MDANGGHLEILVQTRRHAKAVKCIRVRLIAQFGQPCVVIMDKLRSDIKPITRQISEADHRAHKGLDNRIESMGLSIALACRTFQISETCYRYSPVLSDEAEEIAD